MLCEAADAEGLPKLQQLSWTADGDKSGPYNYIYI